MFSYEIRVGHYQDWSTAQGRFGPPLRVAGVQHPAPPLLSTVSSQPASIAVAAPYATPVFAGRNLLPGVPHTQIWVLLYAQVTQADSASQRNVLLDRRLLIREGLRGGRPARCRPGPGPHPPHLAADCRTSHLLAKDISFRTGCGSCISAGKGRSRA
jgi:hypothetical protein